MRACVSTYGRASAVKGCVTTLFLVAARSFSTSVTIYRNGSLFCCHSDKGLREGDGEGEGTDSSGKNTAVAKARNSAFVYTETGFFSTLVLAFKI